MRVGSRACSGKIVQCLAPVSYITAFPPTSTASQHTAPSSTRMSTALWVLDFTSYTKLSFKPSIGSLVANTCIIPDSLALRAVSKRQLQYSKSYDERALSREYHVLT